MNLKVLITLKFIRIMKEKQQDTIELLLNITRNIKIG